MTTSPEHVQVSITRGESCLSLFTALDDCPFIVSSIAERLSDAHIRVNAFLHPIFVYKGNPVAISYIDIEPSCHEAATNLLPRLYETIRILKRVVHDFEPMSCLVANAAASIQKRSISVEFGTIDAMEAGKLLSWLVDGSFFLLGTAYFSSAPHAEPEQGLGFWRVVGSYREKLLREIREDLTALDSSKVDLSIRKLRHNSAVHRPATLLHILVKSPLMEGQCLSLCGYLTSKAWSR
jgi:NAD-specific glutamate dehydrogenase